MLRGIQDTRVKIALRAGDVGAVNDCRGPMPSSNIHHLPLGEITATSLCLSTEGPASSLLSKQSRSAVILVWVSRQSAVLEVQQGGLHQTREGRFLRGLASGGGNSA